MTRDALESLVDAVDGLLPQTQCTRCGYAGCRPYASAVVRGAVPINRCPPGGADGIGRLAALLERPALPLDADCGVEAPRRVARIVADLCIGCTKCIQACPVDAIVGASKRLHAVIPELCTGCDLCLPPCPVDCIEMVAVLPQDAEWTVADADAARARHRRRTLRLQSVAAGARAGDTRKRAIIDAAMARARAQRAPQP
jgi:Na+-translocating ferredoxin:NAD+ oxidoreductase subunit B